jgi:predicted anti-sigma-YlaC factor YlaD/cytoskeletal protein CcmA (bactofilin family)
VACLTEFECSVYADGELPDNDSREVADHLAACAACRHLVEAMGAESRVLVHCLQDTDYLEFELEDEALSAPQANRLSATRLAAFVLAMAVMLRPILDVLGELELPYSFLATTLTYLIPAAFDLLTSIVNNAGWIALSAIVLLGAGLFSRRSILTSAVLSAIALLTVFSSSSYALDVRDGGKPVTVPVGETVDDTLVVGGESVIVDGVVTGDVIAFVRKVTIHGTVKGNLVAFAQRVEIEGTVEGSVMGLAQSVQTRGKVAHNIYALAQTTSIGRDARVDGNAMALASECEIEGAVGKDAFVAARSVNVLAPARIGGNFSARVNNSANVNIESGATIGGRTDVRASQAGTGRYSTLSFYVWQTIWLAAAFLTGLAAIWLVPALSRVSLNTSRELLLSAGVGFLTMIATPIAAIVAAITVIGLPLGLITLTVWLIAVYLAKIVIAGFLGRSLLASSGDVQPPTTLMLLAGLVPIFVAVNLPYVGGLINFLLVMLGLGALVMKAYQMPRWRAPQAA